MPTVMLEVTYDDIDDMRSILRGLRQREGRERGRTLNLARLIAISSLADAIEQHIHDATTACLLRREDAAP
jgi:hypothetical protein